MEAQISPLCGLLLVLALPVVLFLACKLDKALTHEIENEEEN